MVFDNTQFADSFKSSIVGFAIDDLKDYYEQEKSSWTKRQALKIEQRLANPPHKLIRASEAYRYNTGTYGATPEELLALEAFEAHQKDNTFESSYLDGFVSKAKANRGEPLSKYEAEYKRLRTKRDNPSLPIGVQNAIEEWLHYYITGCVEPQLDVRQTKKGNRLENEAVLLYNEVFGTDYDPYKPKVRITQGSFTGECDIDDKENDLIIDIKCSWDLKSFEAAKKATRTDIKYLTQGDVYMHLYGRKNYKIVYVLLDTPEDLLYKEEKFDANGEFLGYGIYSHIPAKKRIYEVPFEYCEKRVRDLETRAAIVQEEAVKIWKEKYGAKETDHLEF